MTKTRYIDPNYKESLEQVRPAIRKEVSYSFDIAKRINDILERKRCSQADLARATGKKTSLVCRWLSGTHNFTIRTIAEIEAALGEDIISVKQNHRILSRRKPYSIEEIRSMIEQSRRDSAAGLGIDSDEMFRELEDEFAGLESK